MRPFLVSKIVLAKFANLTYNPSQFTRLTPHEARRRQVEIHVEGDELMTAALTELKPTRPVLRYHGGKWNLARWIISLLPPHRVYVEPFGGAASVLLQKGRAYQEIYNDLDGAVCNLFQVLRDSSIAADLARRLMLTPFARAEFDAAYVPSEDDVEQARRTIVRSYMGFGTKSSTASSGNGFRSGARVLQASVGDEWASFPEQIARYAARLRGVVIENRDALELIGQHDTAQTLFYVDPPYPSETRRVPKSSG
jgi:DNA adenine methylase